MKWALLGASRYHDVFLWSQGTLGLAAACQCGRELQSHSACLHSDRMPQGSVTHGRKTIISAFSKNSSLSSSFSVGSPHLRLCWQMLPIIRPSETPDHVRSGVASQATSFPSSTATALCANPGPPHPGHNSLSTALCKGLSLASHAGQVQGKQRWVQRSSVSSMTCIAQPGGRAVPGHTSSSEPLGQL